MRALFLLLSSMIARLLAEHGFCVDYIKCMEILEEKQRHCLTLEENLRLRQSTSCSRRRWEIKLELNGLHMRRAELARDCVQKSIDIAEEGEKTLDRDTLEKCESLSRKFFFAPGVGRTSASIKERKKRSASKKKAFNNSRKSRAADCRIETKQWHKQCSALARCCPQTQECKAVTLSIMDQINDERAKLQSLKDEC
ncbi:unnamed protein product, partial [Mesorhabditis belari]|uniref:Uncharacterized protein n=1 Tax=Mesorhabditis belari TaxID=2138241 RepID=A0AAF3F4Y1_9BILA